MRITHPTLFGEGDTVLSWWKKIFDWESLAETDPLKILSQFSFDPFVFQEVVERFI